MWLIQAIYSLGDISPNEYIEMNENSQDSLVYDRYLNMGEDKRLAIMSWRLLQIMERLKFIFAAVMESSETDTDTRIGN